MKAKRRERETPVNANAQKRMTEKIDQDHKPQLWLGLKLSALEFTLFTENSATHLKNSLKPFSALLRVLTESLHASFFYLVFYFLPSTAQGSNLRLLVEIGS